MTNDFRMSYFMPPIAPIKNEQGRIVTPATLVPSCEVSVEQVFQMITCNENLKILTEQVRNSGDIRTAKASLLPYVTPCGTFSTSKQVKCFVASSHLVVVDIDHLDSYQEAVEMRSTLFNDHLLRPVLTFISPSGQGVKAFVPYDHLPMANDTNSIIENNETGNDVHRAALWYRGTRSLRRKTQRGRLFRQGHCKVLLS